MGTTAGKQKFEEEFEALLDSDNPDSVAMFGFIRRIIKQFELNSNVSDILHEVYLRGINTEISGKEIDNPLAWMRSTAYNIVRELSREEIKNYKLSNKLETAENQYCQISCNEIDDIIERIQKTWEKLKIEDREILEMRIINGYSWKEIGEIYSRRNKSANLAALRKRGQRALLHLREIYHSLELEEEV